MNAGTATGVPPAGAAAEERRQTRSGSYAAWGTAGTSPELAHLMDTQKLRVLRSPDSRKRSNSTGMVGKILCTPSEDPSAKRRGGPIPEPMDSNEFSIRLATALHPAWTGYPDDRS